jgi:hypothetical protein
METDNPFVVSLSNHASYEIFRHTHTWKSTPRAWFDKLTTNGIFGRLTANAVLFL